MFDIKPELSAKYILSRVTQEEIFTHFLKREVVFNSFFCSPLRHDKEPTCTFKWVGSYLLYRDWAEDKPYNCFEIVKKIYNCDYFTALEIIYEELIDGRNNIIRHVAPDIGGNNSLDAGSQKRNKKSINITISNYWQKEVVDYLKSYHLTAKQIDKFKFIPVKAVWLDDKIVYSYKRDDPAFAYYFGKTDKGEERWKVYFFRRKMFRFLCNTNRINGWIQLPEKSELLVITKSMKDVACLDVFNIPAISMQNETTIPYDYIMEELKSRFNTIVSLYDFDRTGVINANKLKKLYNVPYLFFTNGRFGSKNYGVKDFSDFLQLKGKHETKQFLNENFF